jgi:anti-anti-sigma regulatory factor
MSGYHSFELCYLAAVYSNLLINKQPMNLYFKPKLGGFKDNLLRVMPDILPPGSVRIEQVWINGDRYQDFDPVAGTVTLPSMQQQSLAQRPSWAGNPYLMPTTMRELKVRVRLAPTGTLFDALLDLSDEVGQLVLYGDLSEVAAPSFKAHMEKIVAAQPRRVVLRMEDLQTIAEIPARMLCFFSDKFTTNEAIYVVGTNEKVKETLQRVGIWEELNAMETYDEIWLRA